MVCAWVILIATRMLAGAGVPETNFHKTINAAPASCTNSASITSFSYDDLHRLTSLNSVAIGIRSYSYSAIGNMMINGDFGGGNYSYGATRPHAVTNANGKSYSYDACGNMTGRGTQTLTYDEENRLIQFNGPSPQVTFGYADGGTRLWRNVNNQELTVWIGGIYEERPDNQLCHVYANGQLIATFEPLGGVFGFIPRTPVVAQTAATLERWFAWPLQQGRTPITVMVATLLGILCVSVLSRWRERVQISNRSTQRQPRRSGLGQRGQVSNFKLTVRQDS